MRIDADQIIPGVSLTYRAESGTISRARYEVALEIVWVENGHVHYRKDNGPVEQTSIDRFLEIVNK